MQNSRLTALMEARFPRKLILVTGMPRSGTTVIGERLLGSRTAELYEPMSATVGDLAIRSQFELVGSAGFDPVRIEQFIWRARHGLLFGRWPPRDVPRNPLFNRIRRTKARVLLDRRISAVIWKDPFAAFWAGVVADQGIPTIVTLRDPLATVASFSRMNWHFDTTALAQKLTANQSHGFALPALSKGLRMPVRDSICLWVLINMQLANDLSRDAPVVPINIDDNLENPERVGMLLQQATGLKVRPLRPPIVAEASSGDSTLPQKAHVKDRSAVSITDYWRKELSAAEIAATEIATAELAARLKPLVAARQCAVLRLPRLFV